MTQFNVHIERLVLDGVALDAKGAEALRQSLEAALAEFADGGREQGDVAGRAARPTRGHAIGGAGVSPEDLGREAALAIHRTALR